MRICGYHSEVKHETCLLAAGHEVRHFDYGEDQRPMQFSVKKYVDNQRKMKTRKSKPAKHVCGVGNCNKYCGKFN